MSTVRIMVDLYCRKKLHDDPRRAEYEALADYACHRLQHCRYGSSKPACKDCPIHCYAPQKRKMIQEVMRWSGPRMMLYSPRAVFKHLFQSLFGRVWFFVLSCWIRIPNTLGFPAQPFMWGLTQLCLFIIITISENQENCKILLRLYWLDKRKPRNIIQKILKIYK